MAKKKVLDDAKVMISARIVEHIINELHEDINYIDMCEIIAIAISATYRSIFGKNDAGYTAAMSCTINNLVDIKTSNRNGRTKGKGL